MKAYLINIEHDTQNLFSWVAVYCNKSDLETVTGFTKRHLNVHTTTLDKESNIYQTLLASPNSLYMTIDQIEWGSTSLLYLQSLKLVHDAERLVERVSNPRVIEGEFTESTKDEPEVSEEVIYLLAKHLQSANADVQRSIKSEYQERYSPKICQKIEELNELPWYL